MEAFLDVLLAGYICKCLQFPVKIENASVYVLSKTFLFEYHNMPCFLQGLKVTHIERVLS